MGEKGKEAVWKEISCLEGKLILTVPKNWERIVGKKVDGLFPYANCYPAPLVLQIILISVKLN